MEPRLLFDTTFLLPFFELDLGEINEVMEKAYTRLRRIYFSEISIYEAKFKLISLYRKKRLKFIIVKNFWKNLSVLFGDKKIIFLPFNQAVENHLNELESKLQYKLEIIDELIIATAAEIGGLVTIDEDILASKREIEHVLGVKILNLEDIREILL